VIVIGGVLVDAIDIVKIGQCRHNAFPHGLLTRMWWARLALPISHWRMFSVIWAAVDDLEWHDRWRGIFCVGVFDRELLVGLKLV
jgi:hypothetical protein